MTCLTQSDLDLFGLSIAELRDEFTTQAVISAAGGRIVGRIRLQKIVFLLDQLGFDSGFNYSYYHYGPYSEGLSRAISSANVFKIIKEYNEYRSSDGAPYSVFVSCSDIDNEYLEKFRFNESLKSSLDLMNTYNSTILELAATILWIKKIENILDWESEVKIRKGPKTENGRLKKAEHLIVQLGIC